MVVLITSLRGIFPERFLVFRPCFSDMSHSNHELASALHRAADLLIERSATLESCEEAIGLVEAVNVLLESEEKLSLDQRATRFVEQMVLASKDAIADGATFDSFAESPYSGRANALAPAHVEYRRGGDTVVATVRLGTALEGRPGRAHGGATAAIFDDVMGALQQVIRRIGYTRTLSVSYFAPFPTDKDVRIVAECTGSADGLFFVEATATDGDRTIAKSSGVFTEVTPAMFGHA
jgi:acyl-coenzyme A thioesterase PaaI-like protein